MAKFILYDKEENFKCFLQGVIKCIHEENLNGINKLELEILSNTEGAEFVEKEGRIVCKDREGNWQEFIIKGIDETHNLNGLRKNLYCEHSFYETITDYIEDKRPQDVPANIALEQALLTSRWKVGFVDDLGINSTNFYHCSVKEAIEKVAEIWKGELRFRIEVAGTKIIDRYVDLFIRRGENRGKRYEFGKDLINFIKKIHRNDVITALYGYGKGEFIEETGGFGRRINFADVEWKKVEGDPIDKPLGQKYVAIEENKEIWGRLDKNGNKVHKFSKIDFDEVEDPEELLQKTWEEYQKQCQPIISYEGKVINIKELEGEGYEHEGVGLGDTVLIIDKEFKPELRIVARVLTYKADLLDPTSDEIILGNYIDDITGKLKENLKYIDNFRSKQGIWDKANVFDEEGKLNAQYINELIDELNKKLNSLGGYVFLTENGKGIVTYNSPNPDIATMAIQILGGAIRIAGKKLPNGEFDFRTFITGKDVTADLINTGILQGGKIKFDLTNGTLLIGENESDYFLFWDGTKLYINGLGVESYATKVYVDENVAYKIEIISSNGLVFKNNQITTVLSAHVFKGKEEVTDRIDANYFRWTRKSDDALDDVRWNNEHYGGAKQIEVTHEDVKGRATFRCDLMNFEGLI
jgi:phage minor structural protein